jgi:integrase
MEDTIYSKQSREKGKKDLELILKRIRESNLTEQEKKDLVRFKEFKEGEGRHPRTIEKTLRAILHLRIGKSRKDSKHSIPIIKIPLNELKVEKPDQFIPIMKEIEKRGWSERTRGDYKKTMILYLKFLDGMRKSRPRGLEFITINKPKPFIDATKLLTFEDIVEITRKETNPMVKALVWFAFESSARTSELISLEIKDIKFVDDGLVHIRIPQTKTTSREFDIKDSKKSLMEWLSVHPDRSNREAPLFVKTRGKMKKDDKGKKKLIKDKIEPLSEGDLRKYLMKSSEKIKGKNTTSKWFRKAGICDWIVRRKVDNPYMLMRIVGHLNIGTAQAYVEFTNTQLTDYLKEKYGLKEKEDLKSYNTCKLCGSLISPEEEVCSNCNFSPNTTFNELRKSDIQRITALEKEVKTLIPELKSIKDYLKRITPK